VVIDSVAGSGKTTCNLHIANHFNDMHILLLTYNSKLKIETRERVNKLNIKNIEIHSYHSFCVKYYDHKCFTDSIINKIINKKNNPLREFNYDLLVLDEAQDISSLYYELICKIYKDNNNPSAKICIFGDKNQSIFSFNGLIRDILNMVMNYLILTLLIGQDVTYRLVLKLLKKCHFLSISVYYIMIGLYRINQLEISLDI
jgi:superfamily I DNA/RNA helicase